MMKIYLNWKGIRITGYPEFGKKIKRKVLELFRKEKATGELSLTFCNDKFMRKINNKYRHKDKSTDVLSFEFGDRKNIIGDIYISIPTAKRQAKEYNVTLENELIRLAMHGSLHVLGYTHKEMGIYGN